MDVGSFLAEGNVENLFDTGTVHGVGLCHRSQGIMNARRYGRHDGCSDSLLHTGYFSGRGDAGPGDDEETVVPANPDHAEVGGHRLDGGGVEPVKLGDDRDAGCMCSIDQSSVSCARSCLIGCGHSHGYTPRSRSWWSERSGWIACRRGDRARRRRRVG